VKTPLVKGFENMPATIDPLQVDTLRREAAAVYSERVVPAFERLLALTENEYLPGARETIVARDLPDGKAWYADNVARRTATDLTPQQIRDIGLNEVKRIRSEMQTIIDSLDFAFSFEDFLLSLSTDAQFYHTTAEGLMREYRDIAKRADPQLAS